MHLELKKSHLRARIGGFNKTRGDQKSAKKCEVLFEWPLLEGRQMRTNLFLGVKVAFERLSVSRRS